MDVQGATQRLLRIVLSWDYFELSKVIKTGEARKLSPVPDVFESVEVRDLVKKETQGQRLSWCTALPLNL